MKKLTNVLMRLATAFWGLIFLLLLVLVWVFSTETGTKMLFTHGLPYIGIKSENVRGSLLRGIELDTLHISTAAADVSLHQSHFVVLWSEIFNGKIHVQDASVNRLQVDLHDYVAPEPSVETSGSPQIPALPVGMVVDNLQLNQFSLVQADGKSFPLDFSLKAHLQEQKQNTLVLDIDLKELDLSGIMPKSRLGGQFHIAADAQNLQQWDKLIFSIQTDQQSLWNAKPLQAKGNIVLNLREMFVKNGDVVDLFLENLKVAPSDLVVVAGDNHIQLRGQLGQEKDVLTLDANLAKLAELYPNIGQSAQVEGQLQGSLAQHKVSVQASYVQQSDTSAQGKTTALGRGPIQLALDVEGAAKQILQNLQWQAKLQQLQVRHAGYELSNQSPVVVKVQAAEALQWSVGEGIFHLKQPSGNITEIQHQSSSQQGGKLLSKGDVEGFLLEKSVYRFHWLFEKAPQIQLSLRMQREQQDDIGVQKVPFANIKSLQFTLRPEIVNQDKSHSSAPQTSSTSKGITNAGLSSKALNQQYIVLIEGDGEKTSINGDMRLNLNKTIPLEQGVFDIQLSDGGTLQGHVRVGEVQQQQALDVDLTMRQLALEKWSLGFAPQAILNADIEGKVNQTSSNQLHNALVKANFLDNSQWNHQPLRGGLEWSITPFESALSPMGLSQEKSLASLENLLGKYRLEKAETDLQIGVNHLVTTGALGAEEDHLKIDAQLPSFAAFYQGLQGGAFVKAELQGGVPKHGASMQIGFAQQGALQIKNPQFAQVQFSIQGEWQHNEGWNGLLRGLTAQYQAYKLEQDKKDWAFHINPYGSGNQLAWEVGAVILNATVPGKQVVKIQSLEAKGEKGQWQTKGGIHRFVINKAILEEVAKLSGEVVQQKGGVVIREQAKKPVPDLVLNLNWDLSFDRVLKGNFSIERESGDIEVPLHKKFDLGLKQLSLKLNFVPKSEETSVLKAAFLLDTEKKGKAKINTQLDVKGLMPVLDQGIRLNAVGDIKDIAWLSMFTDDLLSLGGSVDFDVKINAKQDGTWQSNGFVRGDSLKIVEVENGVRLLDGTLRASFKDTKVRIERLYFPAVIRVTPKEWRTRQWIEENPPAQQGSLSISGEWNLAKAKGMIKTVLDHYPIVQRSDRFAMMSGEVLLEATMPKIKLSGKVTADAGWASIDIKDTVPTVDGDVIVLKPGQTVLNAPSGGASEDLMMNLTVDLGPRFYLVGMGLNSGLVGHITLVQEQGRLTAEGQFRTRGGAIEAYGQRLQIARGEIAFSGNITNPSLNIEALRRGLEVEAGLRVIGTAKRPKIMLVSYPEVSEVEKLSWLIMGRGPDSSGADLALLFSIGGSLIGGEEPFYRRVGIDEIGVRAGSVGEADNILPERTVADSTAYRGYEQANQLFYATKKFGEDWRISAEQALSGSGTVLRGSYRLMKHLTVDLKAGTINGIELLYKRVFKD